MKKVVALLGIGAGVFILSAVVASPEKERDEAPVRQEVVAPVRNCHCPKVEDRWGYVGMNIEDARVVLSGTEIEGVRVEWVHPGLPAERYGLKAGDAIVSVDGTRTYDSDQLRALVRRAGPDRTLRFALLRDGEPWVIEVMTTTWSAGS